MSWRLRCAAAGAATIVTLGLAPTGSTVAATPATTSITVAYGDGPVLAGGAGQTVLISFAGRRGDVVHLDTGRRAGLDGSRTRLLRGSDQLPQTWPFYWRLPSSGTFTFSFRASARDRPGRTLQLEKLRVARTRLDGAPVPSRRERRGYRNAVALTLHRGDRALYSSGDTRRLFLQPGGGAVSLYGSYVQMQVGRPLHTSAGDLDRQHRLPPGRLLVVAGGRGRSAATRSVVSPLALDDQAAEFTPRGRAPREHLFTFHAARAEVVVPTRHGSSGPAPEAVLQGANGRRTEPAPYSGVYWIPRTGTQRYSLITTREQDGEPQRLSLTRALRAPTLPVDGTPVTVETTVPGQYVALRVAGTGTAITATDPAFTSTDATSPTWQASLEPHAPFYCRINPGRAGLGCGDYWPLSVDQDTPSATATIPSALDSVVLSVPPTVSGRVTLAVTGTPPGRATPGQ